MTTPTAIEPLQPRHMSRSLRQNRRGESDPLLARIGNTPLVALSCPGRDFGSVRILVKLESFNPAGSVKDRAAYQIIRAAEENGQLTHDKIILDATSGNTGIAYAMIGARKRYKVKLCLPANANCERKQLLKSFGAELVLTDPLQGSDGAILEARRLFASAPDLYFYADQYNNPENPRAHYLTTAPEIIEQTDGAVTHFVAGVGTSGTMMGAGRRLKEYNPRIQLIAVQPESGFHGLEGLKHMASALKPGIYDERLADKTIFVKTEEAHAMVRQLAREEGLLVGISSGAAVWAALQVAATLARGVIVVISPDGGARYLSERFWD